MPDSPNHIARTKNARLGHRLFLIYASVYVCFVIANAFWPHLMDWTPIGKLNLAVLAGVGLIAFACLLSLLYGGLASRAEHRSIGRRGKHES
jgi:uncharacterized membrane protein (DUF485 family)